MTHILAIDQGTTSSRAILFDRDLTPIASAQQEITQHYPAPGWVEHDAEEIWSSVLATARDAIAKSGLGLDQIAAIGITNQRETTILWDRRTGKPLHRAIVWQDRRTADLCEDLRLKGLEPVVQSRTGLRLDPYFSATKLSWLLDHVTGARTLAESGNMAFGTVDSWLIWNLTAGRVHLTDATNAARTMLYDIGKGLWDPEICAALRIPMSLLPEVRDCADDFGLTDPAHFGRAIPILGVAGDQQAATVGQACFRTGMMKSTYGTGCFALMNTGGRMVISNNRLLSTIAYRLKGQTTYALEGSIFTAGAVVQWLRDGLGVLSDAAESQALAMAADPAQQVMIVPAFTGLGAPYWAPESRGAVFGLTRNSGPAELARAALESVGHQTKDLIDAMLADMTSAGLTAPEGTMLRVDGGMAANDWAMQFLADILAAPVDRPKVTETTAIGAAWLAGMQAGLMPDMEAMGTAWALNRRFEPAMAQDLRDAARARWASAVSATLAF